MQLITSQYTFLPSHIHKRTQPIIFFQRKNSSALGVQISQQNLIKSNLYNNLCYTYWQLLNQHKMFSWELYQKIIKCKKTYGLYYRGWLRYPTGCASSLLIKLQNKFIYYYRKNQTDSKQKISTFFLLFHVLHRKKTGINLPRSTVWCKYNQLCKMFFLLFLSYGLPKGGLH